MEQELYNYFLEKVVYEWGKSRGDNQVALKDALYRLLNEQQHNMGDTVRLVVFAVVIHFLALVKFPWIQANYHYKGKELCNCVLGYLNDVGERTSNHKRRQRIDTLRVNVLRLRHDYTEAEARWKAA